MPTEPLRTALRCLVATASVPCSLRLDPCWWDRGILALCFKVFAKVAPWRAGDEAVGRVWKSNVKNDFSLLPPAACVCPWLGLRPGGVCLVSEPRGNGESWMRLGGAGELVESYPLLRFGPEYFGCYANLLLTSLSNPCPALPQSDLPRALQDLDGGC